jgi:ParB-like chromosome segregation protein Spo0J
MCGVITLKGAEMNIRDMDRRRKQIFKCPIEDIKINWEWNCRQSYNIEELKESIKMSGIQTPLKVSVPEGADKPTLVDGFRRAKAILELKAEGIEIIPDIIAIPKRLEGDEAALIGLQISANQHKKMDEYEQILVCERLKDLGLSSREIATKIGKSDSWVRQRLMAGASSNRENIASGYEKISNVVRSKPSKKRTNNKKLKALAEKLASAEGEVEVNDEGNIQYRLVITLSQDEYEELKG